MSGTSMATPHVSGLAGLLFSKSAGDNSRIRYLIESWAQDLGTTGKDPVFGNGRINAYYAVAPPFRNGK
jgi:subtilisin family serine protease